MQLIDYTYKVNSNYITKLQNTGNVNKKDIQNLIVLNCIHDLFSGEFRECLSESSEYDTWEKVVNHLTKSSCLFPANTTC